MRIPILLCFLALSAPDAFTAEDKPIERIAFGSCNKHDSPQPLWPVIAATDPHLWIWLGDNVYGDTEDMALLRSKYEAQKNQPDYSALTRNTTILGTWDDHDYGVNDGDRTYPKKAESQQILLDFLEEPTASPRRQREGVYDYRTFGPEGRQVAVVLLDVRYHRDPKAGGTTILGEEQWQWLEKTLSESRAQVHLICSGTQILATEHRYEKWADYPGERERLFQLIAKHQVPGVIFLSGDRHLGEIAQIKLPDIPYPLVEITSSGLTHSWRRHRGEPNELRLVGPFLELHFGLLTIDWEASSIHAALIDENGQIGLETEIQVPLNLPDNPTL